MAQSKIELEQAEQRMTDLRASGRARSDAKVSASRENGAAKMPIPASKGQVLPPANLATLNDILTAWQAGKLSYRHALELSGIDNLFDLYQAAISSDVKIRTTLLPREQRVADTVTAAIRAARKNQ